jgi:hypothetical protein
MTQQTVTGGGFNFRHGATYLSPSKTTAIRYAQSTPEGSEIISETKMLFILVEEHKSQSLTNLKRRYSNLVKRFDEVGYPIVVKVSHLPIDYLRSERGEEALKNITTLEQWVGSHQEDWALDAIGQQINFEAISKIPTSFITCYRVLDDNRLSLIDGSTAI